jgi:hypothetical protein
MSALKRGKASLAATAVETANQLLARVQQVKSRRPLPVEWTAERGADADPEARAPGDARQSTPT